MHSPKGCVPNYTFLTWLSLMPLCPESLYKPLLSLWSFPLVPPVVSPFAIFPGKTGLEQDAWSQPPLRRTIGGYLHHCFKPEQSVSWRLIIRIPVLTDTDCLIQRDSAKLETCHSTCMKWYWPLFYLTLSRASVRKRAPGKRSVKKFLWRAAYSSPPNSVTNTDYLSHLWWHSNIQLTFIMLLLCSRHCGKNDILLHLRSTVSSRGRHTWKQLTFYHN